MRIAITGASGLVGSALQPALGAAGHTVVRVVRRAPRAGEISWDPARGELDPSDLVGIDAVVHLAGAGIGDRRWTASYKRTIVDSRVVGTTVLSEALARAENGPRILLSASGVDWYGKTGDRAIDEEEPAGQGFLASLCRRWEDATDIARKAGLRVAWLRSGPVLAPKGGLLRPFVPLFRAGLGGRLGSGRQYWSWISLADQVGAVRHLLDHNVAGPVNLTGPEPVTNAEFTRTLGRVLGRPTLLPVPTFALRIAIGEFAGEVVTGQRVLPKALERTGYTFQHPTIEAALRWATGRE